VTSQCVKHSTGSKHERGASREYRREHNSIDQRRQSRNKESVHIYDVGRSTSIGKTTEELFGIGGAIDGDGEGGTNVEEDHPEDCSVETFGQDPSGVFGLCCDNREELRSSPAVNLDTFLVVKWAHDGKSPPCDTCPDTSQTTNCVGRRKDSRVFPESTHTLSLAQCLSKARNLPEPVFVPDGVTTDHSDESEQEQSEHENHLQDGYPEFNLSVHTDADTICKSKAGEPTRNGDCRIEIRMPVLKNNVHGLGD
jgi:hypothetical protein